MSSEATDEGVLVDSDGGVFNIVINRANRKGSLTAAHQLRIVTALESASTDESLRVVVIRSIGEDFCTGADIVAGNPQGGTKPRTGSIQRRTPLQAHRLITLLQEIQLPVVAVVRGWAAGLGCQIALASDFVVASDTSKFLMPFVNRGFTPDSGATWLLPRLIGIARAKEMLLLGKPISGADAATWGMVYRAVADDALEASAGELIAELLSAATVAVGLTKRCINGAQQGGIIEAMEAEAMALELSSRSADFREGLAAFKQRRATEFEGR